MVSESNKIGLLPAILMVAGNMMGSGVFMLPANLAGIGSIAIIGWLITVVGAIALGLVFAKLTEVTTAAGGPYAYARKAFGDYMGYQTNLVYWLANVIGNVGLAVAGLGYLTPFFPALRDPLVMALAQIAVIWFFTYANILGPRVVGRMQGITTTVALFPIVGVALLGWFWFNPETYMEGWNVSGESSLTAVGMTLNFTLWAFIGVESASVSTAVLKSGQKRADRNRRRGAAGGRLLRAEFFGDHGHHSQQGTGFFFGTVLAGGKHCPRVDCRQNRCPLRGGGLSGFSGRLDASGRTNGSGGGQRRFVCRHFCSRQPPRRSFRRFGDRCRHYDPAGFGYDVADRFRTVRQNRLDRGYHDPAALYLFFGGDQNPRP